MGKKKAEAFRIQEGPLPGLFCARGNGLQDKVGWITSAGTTRERKPAYNIIAIDPNSLLRIGIPVGILNFGIRDQNPEMSNPKPVPGITEFPIFNPGRISIKIFTKSLFFHNKIKNYKKKIMSFIIWVTFEHYQFITAILRRHSNLIKSRKFFWVFGTFLIPPKGDRIGINFLENFWIIGIQDRLL